MWLTIAKRETRFSKHVVGSASCIGAHRKELSLRIPHKPISSGFLNMTPMNAEVTSVCSSV
jgi:hypothetical protein